MRRAQAAWLIGALAFGVYLTNLRPMATGDSFGTRLVPFSVLREGNVDLEEFDWLRRDEVPYYLTRSASGRWISQYPVALPVLVTPLYAPAVWWLASAGIDDDDVRFHVTVAAMERIAAALVVSLSAVLVFLGACRLAPLPVSAGIALVYAFGTATWSISSQALWQHGGAQLALAGLSLCCLGPDTRKTALVAGGCAALGVMVRSSMVIFALLAVVFVLRERRAHIGWFLVGPVVGGSLLMAYNLAYAGQVQGGQGVALVPPSVTSVLGLLVSPNRGLFIYTPAACLALPAFFSRRWRPVPWLGYLGAGAVGYVALFSIWKYWWGGHCYGPRFMADTLPALALAAAPVVDRMRHAARGRAVMSVLVAWGVVVQVAGVYFDQGRWNHNPVSVDERPERVWDWRDLQIVAAFRQGWHGTDGVTLLRHVFTDPRPAFLRPLSPAQLAGAIHTIEPVPPAMRARSVHRLRVRVTNHGDASWPAFSAGARLNCLLISAWWRDGHMEQDAGGAVPLSRNLAAGESVDLTLEIRAPAIPGDYELKVMLGQDLDGTRGVVGNAVLTATIRIE